MRKANAFIALCFVLAPPAALAQKADTTFAYAKENGDGARYVWHLYTSAGQGFPFIPASAYPTSTAFRPVPLDSAMGGDVAHWKEYVAVYAGDETGVFLTAEGSVPVQTMLDARGRPQLYRRHIPRYQVPAGYDIFTLLQGTWGWTEGDVSCESNPHTIAFSADRKLMMIDFREDHTPRKDPYQKENNKAHYEIRGLSRSHIRGFLLDEKRRTDAGELVLWDLVLTGPDSYRWHRVDWPADGYTGEIVRCEN